MNILIMDDVLHFLLGRRLPDAPIQNFIGRDGFEFALRIQN